MDVYGEDGSGHPIMGHRIGQVSGHSAATRPASAPGLLLLLLLLLLRSLPWPSDSDSLSDPRLC